MKNVFSVNYSQDPGSPDLFGELQIAGTESLLTLKSKHMIRRVKMGDSILLSSIEGRKITLVNCHENTYGIKKQSISEEFFYAEYFPHYALFGENWLDCDEDLVSSVQFSTTDLHAIFNDFDAFGQVSLDKSSMTTILRGCNHPRDITLGDNPVIFYYSGRSEVIRVATEFGEVLISHKPSGAIKGVVGFELSNSIEVSIAFNTPCKFNDSMDRIYWLAVFLSVLSGRRQGIEDIRLKAKNSWFDVNQSFKWELLSGGVGDKPSLPDIPLNAIDRPEEFSKVLAGWISRVDEWKISRSQYITCLGKTNTYSGDRLVAAANMFDVLPQSAVPLTTIIPDDIEKAKSECLKIFKQLPESIDRSSILSALGRLGKPSLPKKVQYRVNIVKSKVDRFFPELDLVCSTAIKSRNFYVHGSANDINTDVLDELLPFLTNALEFVFAASDLIELGWDAVLWATNSREFGHSFSRFKSDYKDNLQYMKRNLIER